MIDDLYSSIGTFTPDNLIAGQEFPSLVKGVTLAKNQGIVKRGTVVGIITATGLAKPVDKSKADGQQLPYGIVTDDVDTGTAATADSKATTYVSGVFNKKALLFGSTDTAADYETALRDLGIYLRDNIAY